MHDYKKQFIQYALDCEVLKFGEFQLKSGRISPYFFNTGLFNTGERLDKLGQFYAQTLSESKLAIDILYGPAYKGIPLVSSTAIAYSRLEHDIPYAFNRKEAKNHGEGGIIVGSQLKGNVLILDDVITAGTSVRESVEIINNLNAVPAGVLIALDRQEIGENNSTSAVQDVVEQFKIPVLSIITLNDIISFLDLDNRSINQLDIIRQYRLDYGI